MSHLERKPQQVVDVQGPVARLLTHSVYKRESHKYNISNTQKQEANIPRILNSTLLSDCIFIFTLSWLRTLRLAGPHLHVAARQLAGDPAVTVGSKERHREQIFTNRHFFEMQMFGDVPPDEMLLVADVLVVAGALHHVGHVHDKVHKRLGLLAKEVQEVAEAAVLRDHQHRAWRGNTQR